MNLGLYLLFYLSILNVISFALMGFDKNNAKLNRRRIPEATLFAVAFIGGAAGGWLGMEYFRHKTKHLKFVIGFPVLLIIQSIGITYLNSILHFIP